jgi:hypothetical protein
LQGKSSAEQPVLEAIQESVLGVLKDDAFWEQPSGELELAFDAIYLMTDNALRKNKHRFKFKAVSSRVQIYLNENRDEADRSKLLVRYAAYYVCI